MLASIFFQRNNNQIITIRSTTLLPSLFPKVSRQKATNCFPGHRLHQVVLCFTPSNAHSSSSLRRSKRWRETFIAIFHLWSQVWISNVERNPRAVQFRWLQSGKGKNIPLASAWFGCRSNGLLSPVSVHARWDLGLQPRLSAPVGCPLDFDR
jgi:hypothetical protein